MKAMKLTVLKEEAALYREILELHKEVNELRGVDEKLSNTLLECMDRLGEDLKQSLNTVRITSEDHVIS